MKHLFLFSLLFISIALQAQVPVKINDTTWSIQTVTINDFRGGARTITYSNMDDSLSILNQFYNIVDSKYAIAASRVAERDFIKLDSILFSITGENYDKMMKRKITEELNGDCFIKTTDTTYNIVLDKGLVKKDGAIVGALSVQSRDQITLSGIVKNDLVFKLENNGVYATDNKKKYQFIKPAKPEQTR